MCRLRGREKCMGAILVLHTVASEHSYLRRPKPCRMPAMAGEPWRHGSEDSVAATKEAGNAFESPARGVSAAEAVGVQVPIATLC